MKKLLLIISIFFLSATQAKLWEVTRQWDWAEENAYSDWFQATFTKDNLGYFKEQNMATDCADVAIAARWIYARMRGLPVLQHSATMFVTNSAGERVRELYSQDTMKRHWERLGLEADLSKPWHQDELFMTALNYVLDNTNTYSLSWDSYPVEISLQSMLVGTHHLTFYPNGAHANIVVNAEYFSARKNGTEYRTRALNMINSTLPKAVRDLFIRNYARGERPEKRGTEGFLRMRWPVVNARGEYEHLERNQHPFWSEEQYEESFMAGHGAFYQAVTAKLFADYDFNVADLELLIKFINTELGDRIRIVIRGYNHCVDTENDCSPGTANYDTYSTNNRDDRLQALLTAAQRTFNLYRNDRRFKRRIERFSEGQVKLSGSEEANYHQVSFQRLLDIFTLDEFMTVRERRDAEFLFSSDPRDDFYDRWGI